MGRFSPSVHMLFINNFITKKKCLELPFPIPQLCFVKGDIAYSEKSLDTNSTKIPSAILHCATYLLKELLPISQQFIKYIHNTEAVPLQEHDEPGYKLGVFLCFIQHIRFMYTHSQAYISDLQGLSIIFLTLIKLYECQLY